MSDLIKHECGIAYIRLRKSPEYYVQKYRTPLYGLNKLYLLMEKQHNRGQDGAGVVNIKLDMPPGKRYISRYRSNSATPLKEIFSKIHNRFEEIGKSHPERLMDTQWLKLNVPFTGEIFLGHLRYGTYGDNSIESCHPFLRINNWQTRNLTVAGNFNLTNVDELFNQLVELGQHPKAMTDTVTVMERIGHFLDKENEDLFRKFKNEGLSNIEISSKISENLNVEKILKESSKKWDGGYVMAGIIGNGDSFVLRDPNGIRPAYYYVDDEVVVICSERPVIQTAFALSFSNVSELGPGNALIITKNNQVKEVNINPSIQRKSCSFERIYFSRGSDQQIYQERKKLGVNLVERILHTVDYDLEHTVFSYIPNTAEVAFYGMMNGLDRFVNQRKKDQILELGNRVTEADIERILKFSPRAEKIAIKDAKLRTFITNDHQRDEMVAHVYDITYGTVQPKKDTLVVLDDSIVRGTTLKNSIIKMLDRLEPRKIIIVSSAPQIRYPDCYGIDMARLGDFVAFQAAISLLKSTFQENLLEDLYEKAKQQMNLPMEKMSNVVKEIYKPFTTDQISDTIAELLTPPGTQAEVKIIYQSIEGLHDACPDHTGDWYFTGNYPTPGGTKVVNRAFINYMEGKNVRAY